MATRIPYLDEVWNVTTGCGDDMVSPGCLNCYARRMFGRNLWKCPECDGLGEIVAVALSPDLDEDCPRCHGTGHQDFTPTFHTDRLDQPLHWRKPRRIGVSFMGDLFHEVITDGQIFGVWSRMADCPQHTFLVLTKRPERMRELIGDPCWHDDWSILHDVPLPNVHLGVTVCNQEEADRNVPLLLDTPAAVRWVSYEPAIGPVDFRPYLCTHDCEDFGLCQMDPAGKAECTYPKLDLIVLGGETGPGARPMQPEWALDVCRQCKAAGVAFYWKQWGSAFKYPITGTTIDPSCVQMEHTHELPAVTP